MDKRNRDWGALAQQLSDLSYPKRKRRQPISDRFDSSNGKTYGGPGVSRIPRPRFVAAKQRAPSKETSHQRYADMPSPSSQTHDALKSPRFSPSSSSVPASTPSNRHQGFSSVKQKSLRATIIAASLQIGGINWQRAFSKNSPRKRDKSAIYRRGELDIQGFEKVIRSTAGIRVSQICDADVKRIFNFLDHSDNGVIESSDFVSWLDGEDVQLMAFEVDSRQLGSRIRSSGKHTHRSPNGSKTAVAFGRHESSFRGWSQKRTHGPRIRDNNPKSLRSSTKPVVSGTPDRTDLESLSMTSLQRKAASASKIAREQTNRAEACFLQLQKTRAISLNLISTSCKRRIISRVLRKWHTICSTMRAERQAFQARNRLSEETARADHCADQLRNLRAASFAVIQESQRRRKISRLLRIWHVWYLKKRSRLEQRETIQKMTLLKAWFAWCRYLHQCRFEQLSFQHNFLTSLQSHHVASESCRTLERAISALARWNLRVAWRSLCLGARMRSEPLSEPTQ